MAQFCSIKGFSHDLLWAEWLRPCYLLTDLCPSAWNCECCLTQNLFATGKRMPPTYIPLNASLFWATSWNRLLDLGCCFSSYVSTILYPQPGFPLATDATEPVPWPWFCPIRGKAPFSGSVTAPSCCSSWSYPENPDIGPSTLYLSCKLTAKEWLCPLGRSIFWLSHLQLHFSRLLLQCHFSQASNFSFLLDPVSVLSLPSTTNSVRTGLPPPSRLESFSSCQTTGWCWVAENQVRKSSVEDLFQPIWEKCTDEQASSCLLTGIPGAIQNKFKLAISVANSFTTILSMFNSIPKGNNELWDKGCLPYCLAIWISVLDNPFMVCVLISPAMWHRQDTNSAVFSCGKSQHYL